MLQDVEIILGNDLTNPEDIPLVGKPLPNLREFSSKLSQASSDGKPILLCFVNAEQRPCRQCLAALSGKAGDLAAQGGRRVRDSGFRHRSETVRCLAAGNRRRLPPPYCYRQLRGETSGPKVSASINWTPS